MEDVKNLTGADILSAKDCDLLPVDIPEWGGRVYVKQMTASERDQFEADLADAEAKHGARGSYSAKLAVRVACNKDGERLFQDSDHGAVGRKSAFAVRRIVNAAQTSSALSATALDDAVKNSDAGQLDGSPCDSPESGASPT